MLNFCDFIQVYVFTTNHHLKYTDVWALDTEVYMKEISELRVANINIGGQNYWE